MLPTVKVATPCPADWNSMAGDDKVRFCSLCDLHVYNLSAMNEPDALRVLHEHEGRLCIRIYRRADGTVLTRDCPVGVRATMRRVARFATALLGAIIAAPFLHGQDWKPQPDRLVQSQSGQSEVSMTVFDPIGAVIPGAKVTMMNTDQGVKSTYTTEGNGTLQAQGLRPGRYEITVERPGFVKFLRRVELQRDTALKTDVVLRISSTVMGVYVTSDEQVTPTVVPNTELIPLPAPPSAQPARNSSSPSRGSIQ